LLSSLREQGALAGQRPGAEVYCPVDNAGRFTPDVERFAGKQVFDANQEIVEFLRQNGTLVYTEEYSHRYPHCWRCHRPVIFRATPQWFIAMDEYKAGGDFAGVGLREGALREIERVTWIPAWGRDRMRNMFARRPDWCVSRQRVWGVPIPVFYCNGCGETIADAGVIDHVASVFEKETADIWYEREPDYLLPVGFVCPECGGNGFTRETDILDVWFDSGSSSLAVLERERGLVWPADVYLEGPDQYRGWFNSSLMVGLAAHDRAPFRTVITHGWTVDAEGRAMHKSLGNTISPNEVAATLGAEILRLWVASSDYQEEVRLSQEILKRLVDAYRKLRNTARYALGNLGDFDPQRDSVPYDRLWEIDRWALAATNQVAIKVIEAYRRFDYTTVYHTLYNYATVTLSAVYIDVLKDRLYTFAPKSEGRRSAQTALYQIVNSFARLVAPILVFTADEIFENLPGAHEESVHLTEFPAIKESEEERRLLATWGKLFAVRSDVQKALEEKRNEKTIGASLEASVTLRAGGETLDLLRHYEDQLASIMIVSDVRLEESAGELQIEVAHAKGSKCERCWNWSATVGQDPRFPTLDARCVRQIEEGWGGQLS
jgi:isoleucyl-tRNA synthetase